MRRPERRAWPAAIRWLAVLCLAAGLASPAPAQESEEPAETPDRGSQVEDILAGEFEMLAGEGYTYDPGNRRDPFRSLLAARARTPIRGPRPEGIPGLLIDEIDLTGIFITGDGPVAQVLAADRNESYLLRPQDRLFDGEVVEIRANEVEFRQVVDDPTAIKPYREVVKELNP